MIKLLTFFSIILGVVLVSAKPPKLSNPTTNPTTNPTFKLQILRVKKLPQVEQEKSLKTLLIDYCNSNDPISIVVVRELISPLIDKRNAVQLFLYDDAKLIASEVIAVEMRQQTGRINVEEMNKIVNRLTKGEGDKWFSHTESGSLLAKSLPDSLRGKFFKMVLTGNSADAIKIAKELSVKEEQPEWGRMAARVVRMHDENYNGRVREFIRWVNGKANNPVPELFSGDKW